jgi:cytochrome d ubiquinol oxidase subunit I
MVGLGILSPGSPAGGHPFYKGTLQANRLFLSILVCYSAPYLANQLGWIVAEAALDRVRDHEDERQRVEIVDGQGVVSLLGFSLLYGALGVIDICLLIKYARKGPDDDLSAIIKPVRQEA